MRKRTRSDMPFSPYDPRSWKPIKKELPSLATMLRDQVDLWDQYNSLARYLTSQKVNLSFHRRLRRDAEFKTLVDYLTASDVRRERAAKALFDYLETKVCPYCHSRVEIGDLEDPPPFDWGEFASEETL